MVYASSLGGVVFKCFIRGDVDLLNASILLQIGLLYFTLSLLYLPHLTLFSHYVVF